MTLDQPTQGFRLVEVVFDTQKRCPTLLLGEFPSCVTIYDRSVPHDDHWLAEGEIAERCKHG